MDYIKPYLDYFSANPEWAIAVIFLIALGEALLIIGLFVPSTAVLVGAGMLVGTGHLDFWQVFLATSIGAIMGDQISYWAGRMFGDHLKDLWPLNRYPALVARGEDFVREHGGKSIAIGRFVPGVKAVVPGIVGMLGMNQLYFVFVNFTSGLFWAAAHVFPGILLGQGLALAGELSHRLVIVLVVLLVVLAVAGWLIRLAAAAVAPFLNSLLRRISVSARKSSNRAINRFGRAISPDNPRSMLIVVFALIVVAGILALADIVTGLFVRNAVSNLDISVATLMGEWRNAPADELFIRLTMLADPPVVWTLAVAIVLWLVVWRAWRAAIIAAVLMLCGQLLVMLASPAGSWPSPVFGFTVSNGTFPSPHTLMAGLVFGLISVLASHAMGRWAKAVVVATCGLLVVAIAFSRVYLGADWLSGVLGGILIAAILAALFGVVIEAIPSRRIKPLWLMGFATLIFVGIGLLHFERDYDKASQLYASTSATLQTHDAQSWAKGAWRQLSARRIDLAGQPEEAFVAQWLGSLDRLQSTLQSDGWQPLPRWTWRDAIGYLDPNAALGALAPRPLLHRGLKAKLTLVRANPSNTGEREVLRVYKTNAEVSGNGATAPVFLLSLTLDVRKPRFNLYSVPATVPPDKPDLDALLTKLGTGPGVKTIAAEGAGQQGPLIFLAQP